MSPVSRPDGGSVLRDGGIEWVFYFRKSEVSRHELDIGR